jgi:AcrR family transcriptional regulator/DNA-binding MarR family transcriptional regulator
VLEVQRRRLLAATVDVVAERGLSRVTVAHIVVRSNVSRRTFYDLFADREACFLATFDDAIAQATPIVLAAWESEQDWREKIRAGLTAILEFLGDKPGLRSLLIVDALGAGTDALDHRAKVLAQIIHTVDKGRYARKTGPELPPLTAEGTLGAALSIIHARTLTRDPEPLIDLLNPLMSMIVLPYLGATAARRELTRPVPAPRERSHRAPHQDLLAGFDMRLTYRTVRVLTAIATQPGASNREVAEHSGISDQGQISKLLYRLCTLGLIHNTADAKGRPNVWTLTPHGAQIEQSLRTAPEPA